MWPKSWVVCSMVKSISKLGLGTAQWGLPYGISNQSGQTTQDEVARILKLAQCSGINVIDTARAYGQAEKVLGFNDLSDFKIITKIPTLKDIKPSECSLEEYLEDSFLESLGSMNVDSIHGLLVHSCEDLFSQSGPIIVRLLEKLKSSGKCYKVGVSVYSAAQIKQVLNVFTPGIIQLPFSVFDQRLLLDGTLAALKELGVEIHARSIFLQGLLLMNVENMPSYFKPWMPQLSTWSEICAEMGLSPQHAALDYVLSNNYIDQAIVGVESLSQLADLSSAVCGNDLSLFESLSLADPEILNPSLWNLGR